MSTSLDEVALLPHYLPTSLRRLLYCVLSVYRDSLEYILSETTTCFEKCGFHMENVSQTTLNLREARILGWQPKFWTEN